MKKILPVILVFLFIVSCGTSRKMNKVISDNRTKSKMLYGECSRAAFDLPDFNPWFEIEYEKYYGNTEQMNKLKKYKNNISEIVIIMATWCPDCRTELPRFLKIMDYIEFPMSKIKFYAVDKHFNSGVKALENIKFSMVPTIIFYENNKEIGRIIESPEMTLEEDILLIWGKNYER